MSDNTFEQDVRRELAEMRALLERIEAQRTYEQMEWDLIEAREALKAWKGAWESAPFAAMRECAEAFGQWYDQWRIGYDAESAAKVYAWLTSVGEMFDRQGRKLGG